MSIEFISFFSAVVVGFILAKPVARLLIRYGTYARKGEKTTLYGTEAKEFNILHAEDGLKTPRMGGLLIVITSILVLLPFFYYATPIIKSIFLLLLACALLGGYDDLCDTNIIGKTQFKLKNRLAFAGLIGGIFGIILFVHDLVEVTVFGHEIYVGWLLIPICVLWAIAWSSTVVIDGIDSLAGSIFLLVSIFFVFLFSNDIFPLLFFLTLSGALLPFLWHNATPAKFYMTEIGAFPIVLSFALFSIYASTQGLEGVVGLSFVGILLILTPLSIILQLIYRKFIGKKLFIITPMHHHFERKGIPSHTVVFCYSIVTIIFLISTLLLVI